MKYWIEAAGCDSETRIVIDLTDDQYLFTKHLAHSITKASTFSCMPRIYIKPLSDCKAWDLEDAKEVEPFILNL